MPAFIYYLIFPLAIGMYLAFGRQGRENLRFYLILLGFKISAAVAMAYLLINRYELGDFPLYFGYARWVADALKSGEMDFATFWLQTGAYLVAHLNALVFLVLPSSMYGLAIIGGCASFIYSALIVNCVERHFVVSKWAKGIIYFAPVLSMQAGYVGKETYVLPCIALIVYWLSRDRYSGKYLRMILMGLAVSAFRAYQGFLVLLPLALGWVMERGVVRRGLVGLTILVAASLLAIDQYEEIVSSKDIGGIEEFLDIVYAGGSLTLDPYPFPFAVLQHFRPFPWEAHNEFSFLASMEILLFLATFLWFSWQRVVDAPSTWTPAQKRLGGFLFGSVLIYMVVFSYSSNIGDLSRRHIYYYPFLLLMLSRPRPDASRD